MPERGIVVRLQRLVGTTALAEQLDPEDLRETIRAYHAACARTIERYGGSPSISAMVCWPISGGRGRMKSEKPADLHQQVGV
jgi:class 3 adenylate cyclase